MVNLIYEYFFRLIFSPFIREGCGEKGGKKGGGWGSRKREAQTAAIEIGRGNE